MRCEEDRARAMYRSVLMDLLGLLVDSCLDGHKGFNNDGRMVGSHWESLEEFWRCLDTNTENPNSDVVYSVDRVTVA